MDDGRNVGPSLPQEQELPLSLLVERYAGMERRNEELVRNFSRWLHEHAAHLRLVPLEEIGMVDVVLTFRMKHAVSLVATGYHDRFPGELLVTFREEDFPFVTVILDRVPREDPYEVCTLDYAVAGKRVKIVGTEDGDTGGVPVGEEGVALVYSTLGTIEHLRVRLDKAPNAPVNVPLDAVEVIDDSE